MKHRKVSAVMTPADQVTTVGIDTSFKEIAHLLAEHQISAVPVLDDTSHVIGVVSEADLLAKESLLEERRAPLIAGQRSRDTHTKAKARTAGWLMTSPAITISPDDDVVQAARLLETRRIKRLPVTDPQGRLLGIVSRRDILRLFLRTDLEIRDEVREDVLLGMLWIDPGPLDITVIDGVVHLHGEVGTRSLAELIGSLVHRTDGVVDAVNNLTYAVDDTKTEAPPGQMHGVFEQRRRTT
jgi:predicted transcriptional regulator